MHLHELPLWKRELALHELGLMKPVQPSQCIVWEDPAYLDAPARVTTPSPQWLCMAFMGGILPPVEAYHTSRLEIEVENGRTYNVSLLEAPDVRQELLNGRYDPLTEEDQKSNVSARSGNKRLRERVVRYDVHEAPVLGSISEQDAVEYIVRKDVPQRVWGQHANRPHFLTAPRALLPGTRIVRNSWELGDARQPIITNMTKARREFKVKVGREYQRRMKRFTEDAALGVLFGPEAQENLDELKSLDLDGLARAIDQATSAEQLDNLWPWRTPYGSEDRTTSPRLPEPRPASG